MDESMAHGIGKVGEDNHHVFICLLYLFVFALEVGQLIFNGVFLDQGTTLLNFHLCLIDSIHGFNGHFAILVCGLNHQGKNICSFALDSYVSRCSYNSWVLCTCNQRNNKCCLGVGKIHENMASLKTTKEIIKVHEIYLWLFLGIGLLFW
jgi:hypothetical protein